MKRDFIVWEHILEGRSNYYVEYCPGRTDHPQAHLNVVFTSSMSAEKIAEILEEEFAKWVRLYSVPLFAAALDEKEDTIRLSAVRSGDYLHGYYDPATDKLVLRWDITGEPVPDHLTQPDHLKAVYSALPIKTTAEECRKNAEAYARQMRTLKQFLHTQSFVRFFIWPPIKKLLYEITLIGTVVRFYAYIKSVREWLILVGKVKPSQKAEVANEKKRIEAHWLYHCRENPEGFARLRAENFERDARERIKQETTKLGTL